MPSEENYVKSFEDLWVWQKAMTLAERVYELCKQLPQDEKYGLSSQMKRAIVSVPSNIAEGSERNGTKELIQFLYIAKGSLAELQTQLMLSVRLKLVANNHEQLQLSRELSRGITKLIQKLHQRPLVTGHSSSLVTEKIDA